MELCHKRKMAALMSLPFILIFLIELTVIFTLYIHLRTHFNCIPKYPHSFQKSTQGLVS